MKNQEELLMSFLDGTLSSEEKVTFDKLLHEDTAFAEEVLSLQSIEKSLTETFSAESSTQFSDSDEAFMLAIGAGAVAKLGLEVLPTSTPESAIGSASQGVQYVAETATNALSGLSTGFLMSLIGGGFLVGIAAFFGMQSMGIIDIHKTLNDKAELVARRDAERSIQDKVFPQNSPQKNVQTQSTQQIPAQTPAQTTPVENTAKHQSVAASESKNPDQSSKTLASATQNENSQAQQQVVSSVAKQDIRTQATIESQSTLNGSETSNTSVLAQQIRAQRKSVESAQTAQERAVAHLKLGLLYQKMGGRDMDAESSLRLARQNAKEAGLTETEAEALGHLGLLFAYRKDGKASSSQATSLLQQCVSLLEQSGSSSTSQWKNKLSQVK